MIILQIVHAQLYETKHDLVIIQYFVNNNTADI